MIARIQGKVRGGKFSNINYLWTVLKANEGKDLIISVAKKKVKRTDQQRKYQWVVYDLIGDHIGEIAEEVHNIYGRKFLSYQDDNGYWRTKSTTELSPEEFVQYLDHVRQHAAEFHGINIPDPGEEE